MYYSIVKAENAVDLAKTLSSEVQEGRYPHGNIFCVKGILYHATAIPNGKKPRIVPNKIVYAAVGGSIDDLMDNVNMLNEQEGYTALNDIFWWDSGSIFIQLMVLPGFSR